MPVCNALPNHLRRHREKVFGDGRPRPLDRNAKVRVMTLARALMRRTEKGKAYEVDLSVARRMSERHVNLARPRPRQPHIILHDGIAAAIGVLEPKSFEN